jgi:hypothetical protein
MSTSRLDNLRMVDPVLTTIAHGYSNAAMVAENLFPTVTVSKLKGKVPVFGKEAFVVRNTDRAVRAASNRIPPSDVTLINFETKERDVEIAIDYIEEEESPDFARYEQRTAKDLMDILLLGKEKEAADLVQDADNYIDDLKEEITSANAFDDYSLSTNPINIIRDSMSSVRSRIAVYPNTMIIGDSAFNSLINHPKIIERIKYAGIAAVTTKVLGELLGLQNIFIGMAVYSPDGETYEDVWKDNIVLAFVDQNERNSRSEFNPSFGYTFQREGKPEIDTYYENGGKLKVVRNTDNYCIKVTCSDAAFLISNVNHDH